MRRDPGGPTRDGAAAGAAPGPSPLRPWERLGVRLALFFAAVTCVAVGAVGLITYNRQGREIEDSVGTQLLNIARVAVLQVADATSGTEARLPAPGSPAFAALRSRLTTIQDEALLTAPITLLDRFDPASRTARLVVASSGPGEPGESRTIPREMAEPLGWTLSDGVARYTGVYRDRGSLWISAFAPLPTRGAVPGTVLRVDYPVEIYLDRLYEFRSILLLASALGGAATLVLGLVVLRRLTQPIALLTDGVGRVAAGDLSRALPVRSRDEVGRLTQAFNAMLDGLRQRDFIRSAFGRYVSPEVARAILESPEGLRFGGTKRVVTVLMSDLRGYTRFAEQGEPEHVMAVLNEYLARMADVIIAHEGTINEFIGDAIFAVYNAPVAHPDHAERAAASALAMHEALAALNVEHAARGLPPFEMGIGLHTGDAVVGNIGSEQRAKYAVVGSAVNVASRVESVTVGGQTLLTGATLAHLGGAARVGPPTPVQVKGLAEPLVLYELRGVRGRAAPVATADPEVTVDLALRCWVIEGKRVADEALAGRVVRLTRRELVAALPGSLAPLTNLRIELRYPPDDRPSAPLYGKVLAADGADGLARIRLTALGPEDEAAIARLLG